MYIGIGILAGLMCLILGRCVYEIHHFQLRYYDIQPAHLPEAFNNYKIVMLADLHNHAYGPGNQQLLSAIENEAPDMVVLAGDMLVSREPWKDSPAIELIQQLAQKYPVYFGNGNHEQRFYWMANPDYPEETEDYKAFKACIEGFGVYYLDNKKAVVERKNQQLMIYGLDNPKKSYKRGGAVDMTAAEVEDRLGKPIPGQCNLLIAHNPRSFKAYGDWGAQVVFSGHIHGGVVHLPGLGGVISPQLEFFPKYCSGFYSENQGQALMIVSRGLRMHSLKIRLFNRPELSVITLRNNGGQNGNTDH